MAQYQAKWHDVTNVSWVKVHTEKGGAKTNAHEQQSKRANADAEKANAHTNPPHTYREGYCSQFDALKGAMVDRTVIAHKMGPAVSRHL